jgi:hypothetical protein
MRLQRAKRRARRGGAAARRDLAPPRAPSKCALAPMANELWSRRLECACRRVTADIISVLGSRFVHFSHAPARPNSPGYFQELSSLSCARCCSKILMPYCACRVLSCCPLSLSAVVVRVRSASGNVICRFSVVSQPSQTPPCPTSNSIPS